MDNKIIIAGVAGLALLLLATMNSGSDLPEFTCKSTSGKWTDANGTKWTWSVALNWGTYTVMVWKLGGGVELIGHAAEFDHDPSPEEVCSAVRSFLRDEGVVK